MHAFCALYIKLIIIMPAGQVLQKGMTFYLWIVKYSSDSLHPRIFMNVVDLFKYCQVTF